MYKNDIKKNIQIFIVDLPKVGLIIQKQISKLFWFILTKNTMLHIQLVLNRFLKVSQS